MTKFLDNKLDDDIKYLMIKIEEDDDHIEALKFALYCKSETLSDMLQSYLVGKFFKDQSGYYYIIENYVNKNQYEDHFKILKIIKDQTEDKERFIHITTMHFNLLETRQEITKEEFLKVFDEVRMILSEFNNKIVQGV
jgi:hypothetical protein